MSNTEIVQFTSGALAVAADQTSWTDQQIAVLHGLGIDDEKVTQAEMDVFLHECQRTALDPFTRQIYLIGRYDKKAGREVFRSQTGIDGYRVVAHRAARRDRVELSYADTVWCGPDGQWHEAWIWNNPPLAAKVTVFRDDKPFSAIATLNEYAATYPDGNPMPMWRKMPATMLAKCAEAQSLRKAFPQDLAGIYTAEEMEQADNLTREGPSARPVAQERSAQRPTARPTDDDPWQTPAAAQPVPVAAPAAAEPEYAEVVGEQPAAVQQSMPEPSPMVPTVNRDQLGQIAKLLTAKRTADDSAWNQILSKLVERKLPNEWALTQAEANTIIQKLTAEPDLAARAVAPAGPTPNDPELPAGKSRAMHALFRDKGMETSEAKHAFITRVLGHDIETMAAITRSQGEAVIKALTTGEIPVHPAQGIAPSDEGIDEFAALDQMILDVTGEQSFVETQKAIANEAARGRISADDAQLLRERLGKHAEALQAGAAA